MFKEEQLICVFLRSLNGFDIDTAEKLLNNLKFELLRARRNKEHLNQFPNMPVFKKFLPMFNNFITELEKEFIKELTDAK